MSELDQYLLEQSKDVLLHLKRLGAHHEDAEDIVQNSLEKLFTLLPTLTSEEIRPWLYRVAINEYFDLKRKQKTRFNKQPLLTINAEERATELALEDQELLLHVLAQLPPKQRDLLVLKYYFDLSYKELAELFTTTQNNIRTNLYRARKAAQKIAKELTYE